MNWNWEDFYTYELSDEGRILVDILAAKLLEKYKARQSHAPLGEKGAREIVVQLLMHCWNGESPASYPIPMEVA